MRQGERRPLRGRSANLLDWVVRATVLASGLKLLQGRPVAADLVQTDDSGRGAPAVPASARARHAGHETEDLNGRTLALLVIGMGCTVAVGIGAMVLLLSILQRTDQAGPGLTAQQTTPIAPPAPRLQADPPADLAHLQAAEDARLNLYGWADDAHTRARIPITRAMALMVGRPLETAP